MDPRMELMAPVEFAFHAATSVGAGFAVLFIILAAFVGFEWTS